MKSGKQRKSEIQARRAERDVQARVSAPLVSKSLVSGSLAGTVSCDAALLAPFNSYGVPDFVARGYYVDMPFTCRDCGKQEVWPADRQKWWYEVGKGSVFANANRCKACRQSERERVAEARRIQQQGQR